MVRPRLVVLEQADTLQHILARYEPDAEVAGVTSFERAVQELAARPARALLINSAASPHELHGAVAAQGLPYRTPVIHCAIPDKLEAAEKLGIAAYLLKPIQQETLFAELDRIGRPIHSVLVVDDNAEALQLFARMLSGASSRWISCRPLVAVARSPHAPATPDVVLLDLVMPGMDGFAVLRERQEDEALRDIP